MKNSSKIKLQNLIGITLLSKAEKKVVKGGQYWDSDPEDGCPWHQCRNQFGRCSVFACPQNPINWY